jgi:hypothetical protein
MKVDFSVALRPATANLTIGYFIGLLNFIDDVDTTFAQICQRFENSDDVLGDLLTSCGPQMTAEFIKQHLNRWETEKVRFAVAGRSATGKSTFINTFRGIKKGNFQQNTLFTNLSPLGTLYVFIDF